MQEDKLKELNIPDEYEEIKDEDIEYINISSKKEDLN